VLSALSCARNRYGFYRHSARFKQNSYTHLVKFATNIPISRLYLQLGLAAGAQQAPTDVLGPLSVHPGDEDRLREKLRALGCPPHEEYVVVNPNASDLLLERRWPADRFVALLERFAREGRHSVLVGAPDEAPYVRALLERLGPAARTHVVDTAGRLTIGELLALIAGARCVVTNDTGPMHFAFALRRPTVCLFGPVDPHHYSFEVDEVETLYHPVFCSPCVHENEPPPCGGNNVCMQLIEVDAVMDAVHRLLGLSTVPRASADARRYVDLDGHALGVIARVSLPPSRPPERPVRPQERSDEPAGTGSSEAVDRRPRRVR
jgi:ADP-heptose:LPS heptosyltransferase